ncbi:hypothetical protein DFH09DRAFT_916709 [Mycena vulgaris]|nr:hypothetical protein DFH09DRAFT_916709 [Mycena vulgaris]
MAPTRKCCSSRRTRFVLKLAILGLVSLTAVILVGWYKQWHRITPVRPSKPSPQPPPSAFRWTPTTIPSGAHVHGFTVLDNIYLRNGTFYVVSTDPASLPSRERMLSRPVQGMDGVDTTPGDGELQLIRPSNAARILGEHVTHIEGFSVIVYDPPLFNPKIKLFPFGEWFGEIILGAWRVYSHILLPQHETGSMMTSAPHLPLPQRFIIPFMNDEWRDWESANDLLIRSAFPGAAIEQADYWDALKKIGTTVQFERVMLVNRNAAQKHPLWGVWFKMIAGAMNVTAPKDFWAPVRESLWARILPYTLVPNVLHSPKDVDEGVLPVVTYMRHGSGSGRLVTADHDALVAALRGLKADRICEVWIADLDRMTPKQQAYLASRSTIMVAAHGPNSGLTHQLWMYPTPQSTTIEIFTPHKYSFNYEILARNMGHRHYAVWNDTILTYEPGTYHKVCAMLHANFL